MSEIHNSQNPLVTIIVPIYNAEKYLHRCIDSLINQTLTNIEILLIDDGSTDDSAIICDKYAANDSRIKVFHRTNHGVAATRQFGLLHTTGLYVIHADPDDWVDLDMYEKMYYVASKNHADVCFCDYVMEYQQKSERVLQEPRNFQPMQVLCELFSSLNNSCWNKMILTSSIRKFHVNFIEGFDLEEDRLFNVQLFQNPISISYCPKVAYHYDLFSNDHAYTRATKNLSYIEKRVNYISVLRDLQKSNKLSPCILQIETNVAYQAIYAGAYSKEKFYKTFKSLKCAKILRLTNIPLSWRIIVWSAFHISYGSARLLCKMKAVYRTFVKRLPFVV